MERVFSSDRAPLPLLPSRHTHRACGGLEKDFQSCLRRRRFLRDGLVTGLAEELRNKTSTEGEPAQHAPWEQGAPQLCSGGTGSLPPSNYRPCAPPAREGLIITLQPRKRWVEEAGAASRLKAELLLVDA